MSKYIYSTSSFIKLYNVLLQISNKKQLKSLGKIETTFKTLNNLIDTGTTGNLALAKSISGLTNAEKISVVSRTNLTQAQKIGILATSGVEGAELKTAVSTGVLSTSETTATGATASLNAAFVGLGATLKTFLTTNPLGWLMIAGTVIYGAVKAYDALTISVEEANEALDKIKSEHDELRSSLTSHKKTVNEIGDSYDKLSKGVEVVNGKLKNVSLSDDDYNEFVQMNERLAETFPELVRGIDENGNSILNLGKNGQSAKEDLQDLLDKEEELSNYRIARNIDAEFKNTSVIIENAKKEIDDAKKSLDEANTAIEGIAKSDSIDASTILELPVDATGNIANSEYINALSKAAQDVMATITDPVEQEIVGSALDFWSTGKIDFTQLSEDQLDLFKKSLEIYQDGASHSITTFEKEQTNTIKDAKAKMEHAWANIVPDLLATLKSDAYYNDQDLGFNGTELAEKLLNSFDYDSLNEISNDYFNGDVSKWLYEKIIQPLNDANLSGDDRIKLGQLLDEENPLSPSEAVKIAHSLQAKFAKYGIKIDLGFVLDGKIEGSAQNQLDKLRDNIYNDLTNPKDIKEAEEYTKNFSEAEVQRWLDVTNGIDTAIGKIKAYEQASVEAGTSIGKSRGEMIDSINALSDGFDVLNDIYDDIKDGFDFDFTKLDSKKFSESFKGLEEEYKEFIEAVSESPDKITERSQNAFNKLSEAYIKHSGVLDDVNAENANLTASMLKNMGVANAEEIVLAKLNTSTEVQANLSRACEAATSDMNGKTEDATVKFLEQANMTNLAKVELANLVAGQTVFNNQGLSVTDKIAALSDLATAYMGAAAAAEFQLEMDRAAQGHGGASSPEEAWQNIIDRHSKLEVPKINYTSATDKKSSGGGSGSSKDKWLEEYKEKLAILKDQRDQELIDESQFYIKSEQLMNAYLKNTPAHVEKYSKEIAEAEKQLHSDLIAAFNAKQDDLDKALEKGKISSSDYILELARLGEEYYNIFDNQNIKPISDLPEELQAQVRAFQNIDKESQNVDEEYAKLTKAAQDAGYNIVNYIGRDGVEAMVRYGKYTNQATEVTEKLANTAKDKLENGINAVIALIKAQEKELDRAEEKEKERYEKKIKNLQEEIKEIDKEIDAYNDELDALEKANEQRKLALSLEQARFNLIRAENQRNKQVYKNGQLVFENDQNAVKDARDALSDAEYQNARNQIQLKIDVLEKVKDSLNDRIDEYQESIDKIGDKYDGLRDSLENQVDQWQAILDKASLLQNMSDTKEMFGTFNIEELNDKITDVEMTYLGALSNMNAENKNFQEALAAIAGTDLSQIPQDIQGVVEAMQQLSGEDTTAVSQHMADIATAAGNAASAISGTPVANTQSTDPSVMGSSATATQTSTQGGLVGGLNTLAEEGIPHIEETAQAFEGDEESLGGAVSSVNYKLNGAESDSGKGKDGEKRADGGSGNAEGEVGGQSDNVQGAMLDVNATAQEIVPQIKGVWDELVSTLDDVIDRLQQILQLSQDSGVKFNIKVNGSFGSAHATGTVGKAFAKGTKFSGFKGIPQEEKDALVSEFGQRETVVFPDGSYAITDKPTMLDLPKGSEVLNEDQTDKMIANGKNLQKGKAFVTGSGAVLTPATEIKFAGKMITIDEFNDMSSRLCDSIRGVIPPMDQVTKSFEKMNQTVNNITNNQRTQNVDVHIGDIQVQGVQNPSQLAERIVKELPNHMLQQLHMR